MLPNGLTLIVHTDHSVPDAPQSTIVAAHVSHPYGQPEDLALEPVMENFGGMATSRLNRNLRLEKHWSYGTSARLAPVRGQRSFVTVAPVQTDRTVDAMREVAREIRGAWPASACWWAPSTTASCAM